LKEGEKMVTFGDMVRTERIKSGLTQAEVAEQIGVTQSVFAQYETAAKAPNVYLAAKIADLFGVSLDYLMGGANNDVGSDN
jgi:transcriptional regulator with XRE-family HTH domain